ncbi:MAG: gfo/Idh/MocA family oxidoreductase, partial [Lentisphaeria bacterium]|nr:gfo/Idh/MocA family oxidoreductase [Lentisphaeria bacterium]
IASFDVFNHGHNPIELYGSEGTLIVPDPNTFGGDVKVFRKGMDGFQVVPKPFIYTENSRSIGIADMAKAISDGRPHRASMELARHVIEIMFAFERSSAEGRKVALSSTCERPTPLPLGLSDGELD